MENQLSLFYGLSFLTAAVAFAFAVYLYLWVKKQRMENEKIKEVSALIKMCIRDSPQCGNQDQDKLNVERRTCGYIGTQFWNQGRTQEIKERVMHL